MLRTTVPAAGSRLLLRRALSTAVVMLGLLAVAPAAHGSDGPVTGDGPQGQKVTVSRTNDLDPTGAEVTVTGAGFDESIGIYVAVCVDNGPEKRPTPCLGGVDMSGSTGASGWFSSNPPSYGKDLAQPFGPDGTFELTMAVVAQDNLTDCLDEAAAPDGCVLATFADHSRIDNRSADVRVPLTFGEPGGATPTHEPSAPGTEETPEAETTGADSRTEEAPAPTTTLAVEAPADAASGPSPAPLVLGGVGALVVLGVVGAIVGRRRSAARTSETPLDDARDSDA